MPRLYPGSHMDVLFCILFSKRSVAVLRFPGGLQSATVVQSHSRGFVLHQIFQSVV